MAALLVLLCLSGCGPEGYARIDPGGEYVYSNPAWSPDSQQIAYTRCAIYDIIGPDCGQVVVTLDDQPPRTVPRFDAYCTYHRLASLRRDTIHQLAAVNRDLTLSGPAKLLG